MGKTKSTTRNQNYDVPWSDLNHDVLYLVMMKLGVVNFVAFSGVCKSWRSFALSNWKKFMASRPPLFMSISPSPPPMSMCISLPRAYNKTCHLIQDFDGKKFKTIIPHSAGRKCVGLTCGYLILFGRKTKDFWLVNPITRHELHFPYFPFDFDDFRNSKVRVILVFSPLVSGWLLVISECYARKIWFSIAGKGEWNHVSFSSTFYIIDSHVFKGKIYTLISSAKPGDVYQLFEMKLHPHPKLTLLKTKNFLKRTYHPMLGSWGENLYLMHYFSPDLYYFHELDFGKMKWVCLEKTREEYAFFCNVERVVAIKPESWAHTKNSWKHKFNYAKMWYFPHDCLNVNLID
ncbi:uncharacterized protein LOC122197644 [Lactuca sativa]|uniref:uncharacterized protein LOC122197644 n=1 Tax=Lactuca sativa TaxID=4236 RepID=UPI000CAD05B5|nr:uncharacterized protein LOC122197644 [Lactuca sativa]